MQLLLGIISAAAGAGAAIAYVGLKGNSYARWNKICNVFGLFSLPSHWSFCHYVTHIERHTCVVSLAFGLRTY